MHDFIKKHISVLDSTRKILIEQFKNLDVCANDILEELTKKGSPDNSSIAKKCSAFIEVCQKNKTAQIISVEIQRFKDTFSQFVSNAGINELIELYNEVINTAKHFSDNINALLTAQSDGEKFISISEGVLSSKFHVLFCIDKFRGFIINEERTILAQLATKYVFIANIDAVLSPFPITPTREVLLDTDFLIKFHKLFLDSKQIGFRLNVSAQQIIITTRSLHEIQKSRGKKDDIPQSLLNYVMSDLGAKIIDVAPTDEEINQVLSFWRLGNKAKALDEDKFKRSADIRILVYALRTAKARPVIILSDDHDLLDTIRLMKSTSSRERKPLNIHAVSYNNLDTLCKSA